MSNPIPVLPSPTAECAFDAFISYASADRRLASRLQIFLQRFVNTEGRRLRVYLDETHIRGGDLTEELREALDSSATLIVVCSPAATSSTWVGREISIFLQRQQPRIALVLSDGEAAVAIPESLRSLEIRFHDLRNGIVATVWKPRVKNELLRLVAWLTDTSLSNLINWERRRLVKNSAIALAALFVPVTAVYKYAERRQPIEPSDIGVTIKLSWISEEGLGQGGTIDQAMLNSPTLLIDILPKSSAVDPPPWTWPFNAAGYTGMGGKPVRLVGRLESHQLRSHPSTAGIWFESIRTFRVDAASLGPLSSMDGWDGSAVAAVYSTLGLGVQWPPLEGLTDLERRNELTSDAELFYAVSVEDWQDRDYSIQGVPVQGDLALTLRNRPVATAEALGLRAWEHDEDVRDLHVLIFKPFRVNLELYPSGGGDSRG
jgi:hypothetical protein